MKESPKSENRLRSSSLISTIQSEFPAVHGWEGNWNEICFFARKYRLGHLPSLSYYSSKSMQSRIFQTCQSNPQQNDTLHSMCSSSEFTALQHYPFLRYSGVGNLTRALGELNRLCHVDVAVFTAHIWKVQKNCAEDVRAAITKTVPDCWQLFFHAHIFAPIVCIYTQCPHLNQLYFNIAFLNIRPYIYLQEVCSIRVPSSGLWRSADPSCLLLGPPSMSSCSSSHQGNLTQLLLRFGHKAFLLLLNMSSPLTLYFIWDFPSSLPLPLQIDTKIIATSIYVLLLRYMQELKISWFERSFHSETRLEISLLLVLPRKYRKTSTHDIPSPKYSNALISMK